MINTTAERIATMTVTVRLARKNHQPRSALWTFWARTGGEGATARHSLQGKTGVPASIGSPSILRDRCIRASNGM